MEVYHQAGHNSVWNIASMVEDNAGSGIIFSPVNDSAEKILGIDQGIRKNSFFDPQLYLPKTLKGKLSSFDYFPANISKNFQTSDFDKEKHEIAKRCIDFQLSAQFKYLVIPARYYDVIPSTFYEKFEDYLIEPFISYFQSCNQNIDVLLTVIVKQEQLLNAQNRDELLNWLTGLSGIDGIYLIFENSFSTKQIKDSAYLYNALIFIHILKSNGLKVHVGYTNIEGLIYSIAAADSISMGSYENLRQFGIKRFEDKEKKKMQGPNPRLYSRPLFQMIDYGYKDGIMTLYPNWQNIFEDSRYRPLMFKPEYNWHFSKSEPYKHYFLLFSSQVTSLPANVSVRLPYLKKLFLQAETLFKEIENSGVHFDDDSNGSHLPIWLTTINMFEKYLKG